MANKTRAMIEYDRKTKAYDEVKIRCPHCSHRVIVPMWVDKQICSWCGHYVYRDKLQEFKDNLKKAQKKVEE